MIGALTGVTAAFCIMGRYPGALFLLGLLGVFVALVFQRFFTALLLSLLAGFAAFGVVAWPDLMLAQGTLAGQFDTGEERRPLTTEESLETVRLYTLDLTDAGKRAGAQLLASRLGGGRGFGPGVPADRPAVPASRWGPGLLRCSGPR